MDDPLHINRFISEIIDKRKEDIVGLALTKSGRLNIPKCRSKLSYLISLSLIMGLPHFLKNSVLMINFKIKKKLSSILPWIKSPSILDYATQIGIKTYYADIVNNQDFLKILEDSEPDIIINQSQVILKEKFLSIPKIGVLNRHNSLLPKNRGRLSPFWALYKGDKEAGVSIHFVNKKLDDGDIIVQEKYPILGKDDFNSLVKKNYHLAPKAMLKALNLIEKGNYRLIPNDSSKATYNSIPTFKEALIYRLSRWKFL